MTDDLVLSVCERYDARPSAVLAAFASLSGPGVPIDREAVARVIDPYAWKTVDRQRSSYANHVSEAERREWAKHPPSLAKADEILALLNRS